MTCSPLATALFRSSTSPCRFAIKNQNPRNFPRQRSLQTTNKFRAQQHPLNFGASMLQICPTPRKPAEGARAETAFQVRCDNSSARLKSCLRFRNFHPRPSLPYASSQRDDRAHDQAQPSHLRLHRSPLLGSRLQVDEGCETVECSHQAVPGEETRFRHDHRSHPSSSKAAFPGSFGDLRPRALRDPTRAVPSACDLRNTIRAGPR